MITDEKVQAALARNRSILNSLNPSAASASKGKYLRVIPVGGFAQYPISVQLLGSVKGNPLLTFYGPDFQLAQCDSARVAPECFADRFGAGSQIELGLDVAAAGAKVVDPDATLNQSMVFTNQKAGNVSHFLHGLFAFQWSNDPGEIDSAQPSATRRGMVPVYRAKLGGAASANAAVNFQNYSPLWNVPLNAGNIMFAAIGMGYSVIRHIFGGAGLADGVVIQKWFADPWAYDAGSPPTPIKSGVLVLAANARIVDEAIDMPDRPGWIYLTTETANIEWTMEVS